MKFEILKRNHLKRNIVIGLLVVGIISAIILNFTKAKYKNTESIPLVNGTINYTPYDLKMVAMYQEEDGQYKSIDTVPTSGYSLNEEKSYCEINDMKDNNITIEYKNGVVNFLGMTLKGTKCYLYFNKNNLAKETLVKLGLTANSGTPNFANVATTDEGVYKTEDDWGDSYYFRGNANNWLSFGGYYWRIIRINGDGSIRIIYQGNTKSIGITTYIQTSAFYNAYNDNAYTGYMFTRNNVHGITTNSTAKNVLDKWYNDNIKQKGLEQYIETEVGFCGDRLPSSNTTNIDGLGGIGSITTYYAGYIRLISHKTPSLKCTTVEDLYTINESSKGNHALKYPIGLITADEVSMAGGVHGKANNSYYLYTNMPYWTMTPSFYDSLAGEFFVNTDGSIDYYSRVNWPEAGLRPVINLRNDIIIKRGNGTSSTPYEI